MLCQSMQLRLKSDEKMTRALHIFLLTKGRFFQVILITEAKAGIVKQKRICCIMLDIVRKMEFENRLRGSKKYLKFLY